MGWRVRHHLAGKAHIARSHVFPTLAHLWRAINHSGHIICSFSENSFISWIVYFLKSLIPDFQGTGKEWGRIFGWQCGSVVSDPGFTDSLSQCLSVLSLIFHVKYYRKVICFCCFKNCKTLIGWFEGIGLVGCFEVYLLSEANKPKNTSSFFLMVNVWVFHFLSAVFNVKLFLKICLSNVKNLKAYKDWIFKNIHVEESRKWKSPIIWVRIEEKLSGR